MLAVQSAGGDVRGALFIIIINSLWTDGSGAAACFLWKGGGGRERGEVLKSNQRTLSPSIHLHSQTSSVYVCVCVCLCVCAFSVSLCLSFSDPI